MEWDTGIPDRRARLYEIVLREGDLDDVRQLVDGQDPAHLAVGPVLHQDDLAADKTLAMWGRGEPRDYLDVSALLRRYDHGTLFELARSKDRGLTVDTFVVSLRAVRRLGDEDWADAGIEPASAAEARHAVLDWADRLTGDGQRRVRR